MVYCPTVRSGCVLMLAESRQRVETLGWTAGQRGREERGEARNTVEERIIRKGLRLTGNFSTRSIPYRLCDAGLAGSEVANAQRAFLVCFGLSFRKIQTSLGRRTNNLSGCTESRGSRVVLMTNSATA